MYFCIILGFPDNSVGKESACNAENPGSISGSGRFPGEGIGYPLQYSWASLVAHLVKTQPAMWETWFQFLGWEATLEKGKATHSSILAWRIPGNSRKNKEGVFCLGYKVDCSNCWHSKSIKRLYCILGAEIMYRWVGSPFSKQVR